MNLSLVCKQNCLGKDNFVFRIQKNENLSNLDDDIFLSRQTTPVSQFLPEGDLMTFTPTTPAKRGNSQQFIHN